MYVNRNMACSLKQFFPACSHNLLYIRGRGFFICNDSQFCACLYYMRIWSDCDMFSILECCIRVLFHNIQPIIAYFVTAKIREFLFILLYIGFYLIHVIIHSLKKYADISVKFLHKCGAQCFPDFRLLIWLQGNLILNQDRS